MKQLLVKPQISLCLLLTIFAFVACQKESNPSKDQNTNDINQVAGDRAPLLYGITVYTPTKPSKLIEMNGGTGQVLNNPGIQLFILADNGEKIFLNDLKGICLVNGRIFVTTGASNTASYNNLLINVDDLSTGHCSVISASPAIVGTVSDIDYDPSSGTIYGLRGNSNSLVTINDNGTNWGDYAVVGPINNLAAGFVAKGLTMVRDGIGMHIVAAATTNTVLSTARIYDIPPTAGGATFLSEVNPGPELASGHCALGFLFQVQTMLINRAGTVTVAGLNFFDWPVQNPTGSEFFGGAGFNFEDLATASE